MSDMPKVAIFPRTRTPQRPRWLRGHARQLWDRLAPEMVRAGWLDELTAEGFAMYCAAAAHIRRLHGLVERLGMERAAESGVFGALLQAEEQFLDIAAAYFCTPASRAAAGVVGPVGA
jgi:phage terminase small subunit